MTRSKTQLLVPITSTSPDRAEELALALAEGYGAELHLLNPIVVPIQTPLTLPEDRLEHERNVAGEVLSLLREAETEVDVHGGVRVGHNLRRLLVNAAAEYNADLVVLDADMFSEEFGLRRRDIRRIARGAPCDVLVVSGTDTFENLRTVLVPIAGGPHSGLAVEVATALDEAIGVWVDVLHVIPPLASVEDRETATRLLSDAVDKFDSDRADDWLLELEDVAGAIIEESQQYDLTILGTPERSRLKRFLFGSTTDAVVDEAGVPVIVAWRDAPGSGEGS